MGGLSFNEEVKKPEVKITDIDFGQQTGTLADLDKAYGKIASTQSIMVEEKPKDRFFEMLKKINPTVEEPETT